MTTPHQPSFTTQIVHADRLGGAEHGAIHKPIHTSVQYGYDKVEDLIAVFQGTAKGGFNYARQGTPTTAALESKITQMEQGLGTIVFSTGMAGICAIFMTLLKAGDHLVASQYVFGNTNSVFGTLANLGIEITTVDVTDAAQVAAAVRPNTRMVFVETIANPGTQIPDLAGIGALCRQHGLLYVVDNTVASPYIFRAGTVGAGLVVNSLTKSIGGHGDALGGAVTDTGLYDWSGYPNIFAAYCKGDSKGWGLQQLRKKGLRDMGGTLSSHAAHQLAVGAETLALRMERTSATALALARWLEQQPAVARVLYPMLESHPQHAQAKQHFRAGSWLLSFELRDADQCLTVCNRLQLPIKATGLADTRTLIIPVAHTIFWEAGPAVRATMGIADGMIRLSIGLEEADDLLADFAQALSGL
ncbi:cystathionine gamma-synthase family protein [Acidovorax sp. RAC01]|uniref:cystathionine gamma-synthase family protein n=1 Tax=Acidovorax sp. RAC01 TaxID=1842533 RepID=UPI00083E8746|nr:cystathionine gamma-synthase family protein [Acidovorax sp. RAC01]AOG25188.1 cys/Met metabolism PLP-dependent enzyme family protein [Acidovorax sp. RAC01]